MLSIFLSGFQMNAVFLVLGAFLDARATGLVSWGYQIASQAIFLLVVNLRQILVPTLVKLNGQPQRQRAAFYRAAKGLTAVAIPVCLVQALLAYPLIPYFFGPQWVPAVPVVVWMSAALASMPLSLLTSSLFTGKAMNGAVAALAGAQALLVLAGAAGGAMVGDYLAVTRLVALGFLAGNVLAFLVVRVHFRKLEVPPPAAEMQLASLSC
jgi:PST family polysaccharide transporter